MSRITRSFSLLSDSSCEKLKSLTVWHGSADKSKPQRSNIKAIKPKKAGSLKSLTALLEVSANRPDVSIVITFQLAKLSPIFLLKSPQLSICCQISVRPSSCSSNCSGWLSVAVIVIMRWKVFCLLYMWICGLSNASDKNTVLPWMGVFLPNTFEICHSHPLAGTHTTSEVTLFSSPL